MSKMVLDRLLRDMKIKMDEKTKEDLWEDVRRDFSIAGSVENERCEHLELMTKDRRERRILEDYIRKWMEKRKKEKKKLIEVPA